MNKTFWYLWNSLKFSQNIFTVLSSLIPAFHLRIHKNPIFGKSLPINWQVSQRFDFNLFQLLDIVQTWNLHWVYPLKCEVTWWHHQQGHMTMSKKCFWFVNPHQWQSQSDKIIYCLIYSVSISFIQCMEIKIILTGHACEKSSICVEFFSSRVWICLKTCMTYQLWPSAFLGLKWLG